jgi:hypothetical protein
MTDKTVLFVREMVSGFPGLAPLLKEHLDRNLGEVLPHVFFGDVTRYVVKLDGEGARAELQAILDYLEETFAAQSDELGTLISVSFLENLQWDDNSGTRIRNMIGPHLKKEIRAIGL